MDQYRQRDRTVGSELNTQYLRRQAASSSGQQSSGRGSGRHSAAGYVAAGYGAAGYVAAASLALAMTLAASPAAARHKMRHEPERGETERVNREPFGDIPKGQLQIFVSINQQKLHLYSDGVHVADCSVATGVPSLPTPLGVFSVIQKQRFHRSNIYSNAPMPFMQRITWSGVALHEGENIGHPASHGCIRMPRDFAARLWSVTRIGVRVIVARNELKPVPFADFASLRAQGQTGRAGGRDPAGPRGARD